MGQRVQGPLGLEHGGGRQKHSSGAQRSDEGDVQEKQPDPGKGYLQKQSW